MIEFDRGWPLIVDRALYRELVKQAIARTLDELEVKVTERAAEKKANRGRSADEPADPVADARREEQRQLRELSERAHGVNLDLGAGLLTGLATVNPSDMDVARVFVLCRRRHRTNYADGPAMPRTILRRRGEAVDGGLLGLAGCSRVGIVSRGSRGRRGRRRWACSGPARRRVASGARGRVL